jgi:hypothetical protein
VDTVVGSPLDGKELRSKRKKVLSAEERRETHTVKSKLSRPQVRDKVKFELEASVQEPQIKFRYYKHPKASAEMRELPHTLQESGGLSARKEVFGKLGGQAKNEFHTAPVQSSSKSMEVPLELNLILTQETGMFHATPEYLDNVHRQLKQSNSGSSSVTDEVKTRRGAAEGVPKVDVKQVADTVNIIRNFSDIGNKTLGTSYREFEVLPDETEIRFEAAQGKLNVNEPDRLPTPKLLVSLAISVLTKCEKLINICRKACNFSDTGNEMPETLHRESIVLHARTETVFGAIQELLNINEPNTIHIPKHSVSMAIGVLIKCEKLASMCTEITVAFPDRLPSLIMTSSIHPLHPRLFFMLAEISFLIIKLFSELISSLISLIYIIIHAEYMDIVPENIISSLDTLIVALFKVGMKYKILCTRYILQLNILSPGKFDQMLQNYQRDCIQIDMSEQTDVPRGKVEMPSHLFETLYEEEETCTLGLSEVSQCSLTLLQKDSIKIRLMVIGIKLSLIGEKILPLTALK